MKKYRLPRPKSKYGNCPTAYNGVRYASKLEADYAKRLELAKKSGDLLFYLEQVPFRLPGGIVYKLDFMEFWAPGGDDQVDVVFTEVKGFLTPLARSKLAIVTDLYSIKINIVKK